MQSWDLYITHLPRHAIMTARLEFCDHNSIFENIMVYVNYTYSFDLFLYKTISEHYEIQANYMDLNTLFFYYHYRNIASNQRKQ